jgi:hypothetical protein
MIDMLASRHGAHTKKGESTNATRKHAKPKAKQASTDLGELGREGVHCDWKLADTGHDGGGVPEATFLHNTIHPMFVSRCSGIKITHDPGISARERDFRFDWGKRRGARQDPPHQAVVGV